MKKLTRDYDFESRCHNQANKLARSGDFGRAMQKVNAKPVVDSIMNLQRPFTPQRY